MKTLDLSLYGVQEMNQQEMIETDGGAITAGEAIGWTWGAVVSTALIAASVPASVAYVGIGIALLVGKCAQETHDRGTLMNMHQNNPKLWN